MSEGPVPEAPAAPPPISRTFHLVVVDKVKSYLQEVQQGDILRDAPPKVMLRSVMQAIEQGDAGGVRRRLVALRSVAAEWEWTPLDESGFTLLHSAASRGSTDVCTVLLQEGHPIDPVTTQNETPLMIAARMGASEVCRLLLAFGASTERRNTVGLTAAEMSTAAHGTDVTATTTAPTSGSPSSPWMAATALLPVAFVESMGGRQAVEELIFEGLALTPGASPTTHWRRGPSVPHESGIHGTMELIVSHPTHASRWRDTLAKPMEQLLKLIARPESRRVVATAPPVTPECVVIVPFTPDEWIGATSIANNTSIQRLLGEMLHEDPGEGLSVMQRIASLVMDEQEMHETNFSERSAIREEFGVAARRSVACVAAPFLTRTPPALDRAHLFRGETPLECVRYAYPDVLFAANTMRDRGGRVALAASVEHVEALAAAVDDLSALVWATSRRHVTCEALASTQAAAITLGECTGATVRVEVNAWSRFIAMWNAMPSHWDKRELAAWQAQQVEALRRLFVHMIHPVAVGEWQMPRLFDPPSDADGDRYAQLNDMVSDIIFES